MTKKNPEGHKAALLKALERALGVVTPACLEVGISRKQFYHYYKTDEDFKKEVDQIQDIALDFAETQLFKKIKEGSERSILFYMKYRGRSRGYTQTSDINVTQKIETPLFGPDKDIDETEEE